jgi:citrate/tricarballylate utilization protein
LPDGRLALESAKLLDEGERLITICNACRYCEGYCAVFPALERRKTFTPGDIRYLANLCHNCAECYYACQYAPPHEFAVKLPKVLAEIRLESYAHYAWPKPLAAAFRRNGLLVSLILAMALAASIFLSDPSRRGGNFYAIVPHELMVAVYGGISVFVAAALAAGLKRFWKDAGGASIRFAALRSACGDALRLRYLSSRGAGCTYPDENLSELRRWLHHLTFYGFVLCFAATLVAAIYHYLLNRLAPYGYFSVPVILGLAGGVGLLIGPAGLLWLKLRRDPAIADPRQDGFDLAFLALLFATSLTGLLLLILRSTTAMPLLLTVHLATVLALFLTLPYGKFVHGVYRGAALLRNAGERHK